MDEGHGLIVVRGHTRKTTVKTVYKAQFCTMYGTCVSQSFGLRRAHRGGEQRPDLLS